MIEYSTTRCDYRDLNIFLNDQSDWELVGIYPEYVCGETYFVIVFKREIQE
jgi:hypothetical protein